LNKELFPTQARVVIVGGGIMGCGIAYHLAHEGWTDIVLLEKAELTSGSTWHAAGQITHSTSSFGLGKCVDYNINLYSKILEAETGQSSTWHGCGSFRLAYTEDEMDWLRHTLSVGRSLGFNIELVGPERVKELHPFYNLEGVIGALHTPDDGTYARQMGEWSGLQLPMTSMTHHYFVTEEVPEFQNLEKELPVIRDDKKVSGYIRMEQKKGLIGIYEKANPNTVWEDHCPWDSENELFEADYDRVMPWLEESMNRMPIFSQLGIQREVHGAISHPPDGNPLIGPAPGVKNYWCCCGTQIGIGWGPGLTRELARWMVHGAADISMRRPIKPSPLHEVLKEKGAIHEEVYGFERPRWFARNGVEQKDHYSFRRNEVHDILAHEVKAVREAVGINRLTANKMPKKVGSIGLTHMLNKRGRIELETTIVKMAEDAFYLVCAAFFEQRLLDHLNHNLDGEDVSIEALSADWSALTINGPKSRDVLAACTDAALDNVSFRWLSAQEIEIAGHKVWAFRMSYAGELGWEFHMPNAACLDVYNALWNAGEEFGIENYGSFAMNIMRMEKGFKGAGELTNEVTLPEADVMRFVDTEKDYLGKEETLANKDNMPWICAYLEIEPDGEEDGHGGEAVMHEGKVVGSTASVVYGHTVGKILAFAYIKPQAAKPDTALEVVIAGNPRKARVLGEPPYDPQSKLPRVDA